MKGELRVKTNHIKLRPDRLNAPLAECFVGRLSSAVFVVYGDIPDDISALNVQIGRTPDSSTTPATERANLSVAAVKQTDGTYRAYLNPYCFPDLSEALKYHVVATDTNGNPRWLGTGALIVRDNPANGSPVTPEVVPQDCYAYNPVTQKYHKITATVDEYGEITIEVSKEGITR